MLTLEYLAKQYAITNATEPVLLNEWRDSMNGIRQHLLGISRSGVIFVGERDMGLSSSLSTKMDHLVCFLPGTIAMIAKFNASMTLQDTHDFQLAQEILDGCIEMYLQTVTGLSPEIVFWNEAHPVRGPQRTFNLLAYHQTPPLEISPRVTSIHHNDFEIHPLDGHNLLRPETVESLYYLYHYTQDIRYRQVGYTIFEAFLNHTKLDVGFSSIDDVREIHTTFRDKMETFWVGETLKYFYLLFGESTWLDDHVFNTEAHPFPIFELVPELQNIVLKL